MPKKIDDPQNPSSIENEVDNNKYGISSSKITDSKLIPPVDNDAPIIVLCIRFCGAACCAGGSDVSSLIKEKNIIL